MSPDALTAKIRMSIPDAEVVLEDLTGTQDHWKARIVSSAFAGKTLIQRHRMVMAALADEMATRVIHALTMDTLAPGE